MEASDPDQRAQGNTKQHTPHELLNKSGKLLVLCSQGVLSKNKYICQIDCRLICGNDDVVEMAKVREQSRRWALTADSPRSLTVLEKKNSKPLPQWDANLTTLKDISNIVNADKERHRVHFCPFLN